MTGGALAGRARPRTYHWFVVALLAVLAVAAVDYWRDRPVDVPAADLDPAALRPGPGPRTFTEALASADHAVEGARQRLAASPDEWLRMEVLARALTARYRLTADAADLAEADRLLDRAIASAPWPAGPALSRAAVSLAVHDLDAAETALARFDASVVPPPAEEQAEARSVRCEIAFQHGRVEDARRLCAPGGDLATALRGANIAAKTGETGQAALAVEALLRRPGLPPATLATLALQRASLALAEGDWEASGRWARAAAERVFPGYWLSEAYVAQQYALEGNRAEARRRYAGLAERTGDADVLDALAVLAQADGRTEEARGWAARAGAAWRERSGLLPLAYAGHQAEHLLLHGAPRAALALTARDYRRRPHPATTVHYALALQRNGQPGRALAVVRGGEAQGFLTADMKLAEATALGALGRAAEGGQVLAEARRLNPRIDSFRQQFVTFAQN